jgi:hypothetical protein
MMCRSDHEHYLYLCSKLVASENNYSDIQLFSWSSNK